MDEEIKYYPYDQLGDMVNADIRNVTQMLLCMMVLEVNDDPNTLSKYGKLSVALQYKIKERENYKKFFRERFYMERGKERYALEITDEFVDFVIDRIEKVGELYHVKFKK
jgi:hypothetical protein